MSLVSKILVPTDFSPHAQAALQFACELAKSHQASLYLVHVYDLLVTSLPEGATYYDTAALAYVRDETSKRLAQVQHEALAAGVKRVETKLIEGQPYREIVRAAEESRCELIVMGTHGRTGIAHVLLGSVAERVARKAPCPVITVPCKEQQPQAKAAS